MIKNLIIILFTIIVVILFLIYGTRYTDRQLKTEFNHFNKACIDGMIEYAKIRHHGVAFKVSNDPTEFIFYPYTDSNLNNGMIFNHIASPGDRVIKPALSDTLTLWKSGNKYKYSFKKI